MTSFLLSLPISPAALSTDRPSQTGQAALLPPTCCLASQEKDLIIQTCWGNYQNKDKANPPLMNRKAPCFSKERDLLTAEGVGPFLHTGGHTEAHWPSGLLAPLSFWSWSPDMGPGHGKGRWWRTVSPSAFNLQCKEPLAFRKTTSHPQAVAYLSENSKEVIEF